MVNIFGDTKTDDFIAKVKKLIEAGERDEALEMIRSVRGKDLYFITLKSLVSEITNYISIALDRDRDTTHSPVHRIALALTAARALGHALDRDRDHIFQLIRVLDNALDRALVYAFDNAPNLAYAVDFDISSSLVYALDCIHFLARATRFSYVIINTLTAPELEMESASVVKPHLRDTDNSIADLRLAEGTFQFTLTGSNSITPSNLATTISPYLQALFDLQRIISDLKGESFSQPRIISLSQNSPVTAELSSTVADAVEVARKLSTAEGRELAREADRAAVKDAQANVALKEAQASETEASELKLRAEAESARADAALKYAQAEQLRAEADKTRFEIEKTKVELGLSILRELGPNLSEVERTTFLMRLMQPLGVLIESPLRPDTLPK